MNFKSKVDEVQNKSDKNTEKYLETLKKERELLMDKMAQNDQKMVSKLDNNENKLKVIMEENQKSINVSLSFLDESISRRDQEMINRFSHIELKMENILDSEYQGGRDHNGKSGFEDVKSNFN